MPDYSDGRESHASFPLDFTWNLQWNEGIQVEAPLSFQNHDPKIT